MFLPLVLPPQLVLPADGSTDPTLDASEEGGSLLQRELLQGGYTELAVSAEGSGVPPLITSFILKSSQL